MDQRRRNVLRGSGALVRGLRVGVLCLVVPGYAAAETGGPVVVWPTLTPAGDDATAGPLRRPTVADRALAARAEELDATLRDAAADLGFTVDVTDRGPAPGHARDADIIERADKS